MKGHIRVAIHIGFLINANTTGFSTCPAWYPGNTCTNNCHYILLFKSKIKNKLKPKINFTFYLLTCNPRKRGKNGMHYNPPFLQNKYRMAESSIILFITKDTMNDMTENGELGNWETYIVSYLYRL